MKDKRPTHLALLLALLATLGVRDALAVEFRSLAQPAVLYDAPSERGKKLSIILPGTPVEVIVGLDRWLKVRDPSGAISWVERQLVEEKRTVMVNIPQITVRQEASTSAPVSFEAGRGVILELIEAPRFGWIKVRHADGSTGFAKAVEVWGL